MRAEKTQTNSHIYQFDDTGAVFTTNATKRKYNQIHKPTATRPAETQ